MAVPIGCPRSLADLRAGGKVALARALTAIETAPDDGELIGLLDAAFVDSKGHVLGITGPPGVGKSTLTNALLQAWRRVGKTVGVIAVDPSSRVTRGALLGDRTRIRTDPDDPGTFVRSMAARDRLGGLSAETVAAMVLFRAVFDITIVESVGIGQSEADISFVADTVLLCLQPGSGDSLQFMKAGIMELPDILAVTKIDQGMLAERARADAAGALGLSAAAEGVSVLAVSAATGQGIDGLIVQAEAHAEGLVNGLITRRARQSQRWLEDAVTAEFGRQGLIHARDL
ncbi:MAG: methylmalonyl Co-A mutase-associated GTPase MeaB, partial [Pseudomonadota bacterium]